MKRNSKPDWIEDLGPS